jgi:hypothetical protein
VPPARPAFENCPSICTYAAVYMHCSSSQRWSTRAKKARLYKRAKCRGVRFRVCSQMKKLHTGQALRERIAEEANTHSSTFIHLHFSQLCSVYCVVLYAVGRSNPPPGLYSILPAPPACLRPAPCLPPDLHCACLPLRPVLGQLPASLQTYSILPAPPACLWPASCLPPDLHCACLPLRPVLGQLPASLLTYSILPAPPAFLRPASCLPPDIHSTASLLSAFCLSLPASCLLTAFLLLSSRPTSCLPRNHLPPSA